MDIQDLREVFYFWPAYSAELLVPCLGTLERKDRVRAEQDVRFWSALLRHLRKEGARRESCQGVRQGLLFRRARKTVCKRDEEGQAGQAVQAVQPSEASRYEGSTGLPQLLLDLGRARLHEGRGGQNKLGIWSLDNAPTAPGWRSRGVGGGSFHVRGVQA